MRIAQVATLSAPVCENSGGSVEGLVWLLSRELVRLGHEVTVYGIAGSTPPCKLVATLPDTYATNGSPEDWHLCEWINLSRAVADAEQFDVIHMHAYLWGVPLQPLAACPLVHTHHIVPDDDTAFLWRSQPGACVTGISRHQWSGYPDLSPAAIVPHGVDAAQFTFEESPEDYVCYLGRFVSGKGPLHAIDIARKAGVRLKLAGPSNPYFREQVQPLVDGDRVEYVGYVSGKERDRFLGGARAMLYPIQHPEAFGLVLLEAMLCGTPVVANPLGAVPEIVTPGQTGVLVASPDDWEEALAQAVALDRSKVRLAAEQQCSVSRMAEGYLKVYESLTNG